LSIRKVNEKQKKGVLNEKTDIISSCSTSTDTPAELGADREPYTVRYDFLPCLWIHMHCGVSLSLDGIPDREADC
jgi:hypothetical protein